MRILITGASGSGTSTLGRAVAARSKCAFFDADDYFWLPTLPPFQQKRERAARLALLLGVLGSAPAAVVAGSIVGWGAELEESFSLIVFLTLSKDIRLERLRAREQAQLGAIDQAFLDWAAKYDDGGLDIRSRTLHEHWLATRSCPVVRIDGDVSVDERVARVLAAMPS